MATAPPTVEVILPKLALLWLETGSRSWWIEDVKEIGAEHIYEIFDNLNYLPSAD